MTQSHLSQKQKDSRSHLHHFIKRSLSQFASHGRKRRLFVAGIIALSGVAAHHISPHSHRAATHHGTSFHYSLKSSSSSPRIYFEFAHGVTLLGVILLSLKKHFLRSTIKDYSNYLYVISQDIRGSPTSI